MTKPGTRLFADHLITYVAAGWPCVLPVPPARKYPPPGGFTGAEGRDTDLAQLAEWAEVHPDFSVALRMPDGVIGLDVDHYTTTTSRTGEQVDKRGADTLADCEQRWGPLPATWVSTARELPSGIRFYRAPAGRYRTSLGEAVEIIQRHHRYAVVAPSAHPSAGGRYRWITPEGAEAAPGVVPKPGELPELPTAWVEGLREGATEAGPVAADAAAGRALLAELLADDRQPCAEVFDAHDRGLADLGAAAAGGRHDTATARTHRLVQLGAAGHPGAGTALAELRERWLEVTAGEDREAEYDGMLLSSARKAVTEHGPRQYTVDPCLNTDPIGVPQGEAGSWSVRRVIGAHAFDPQCDADQRLAEAVLERMRPALRYAVDAGTWLVRGRDRWQPRGDLSRWAITELVELMPRGDSAAGKDTKEYRRARRQARLASNAGAGAVAGAMRALAAGDTHPNSLEFTDLDADPEVLWAGGRAWDLRASLDAPVEADLDPETPHQHSALVAPDPECATPLWDAYTAAVWPDAEVRAWALRVLAITLTGYPDAALPILLGPTRRGKSQTVELVMSLLGTYAHAADTRLLSSADSHASIVFALKGRRLSFIDEGPREGRWAIERLKQLTGGTQLTGNRMRENPITFTPTHTLVLTANAQPQLADAALRARVRLIPCTGDPEGVRTTRAAIGPVTGAAWRAEAPGVLAALMREAAAWLADAATAATTAAPVSIRGRAEELAAEQDHIRSWIADETEPSQEGTKSSVLYRSFVAWCRDMGIRSIPTISNWGQDLTELGHPAKHREGGSYRPLRLRQPGGWAAHPPALTSPDTTGPAPVRTDNSRPEAAFADPLTGLTPFPPTSTTTTTTTHKTHTKNTAKEGVDRQAVSKTRKTPPPPRSEARQPAPDGTPAAAGRHTRRPARTNLKTAATQAHRAAAITEAAGPRVGLPAMVERAEAPRPVSLADATHLVREAIARAGGLTVDVETTGYPLGHHDHQLRTVQLGDAHTAVVLDATCPEQAETARELLAAAPRLHAHSATADLVPLAHAGLVDAKSGWERMWDTVIPAKLADPDSTGSDPGLKKLAESVLGEHATAPAADTARAALFKVGRWLTDTKPDTSLERSGWAQVDPACETMVRYAASDVLDTAALAHALPAVDREVVERERAVQRITARVTHRGLRVDSDRVEHLITTHTTGQSAAAERVRAHGVDNPGSDQQLATVLTELGARLPATKTGRASVAAPVLDALKGSEGPVGGLVDAVLDYRHHETVLGLFLRPYQQLCQRGDSRARPTVYTLGAGTGRMSCTRPNLQQLSRQGGVRACITADPGQVLISADFSGVELRVAAALSGDESLKAIIADGRDLHMEIAQQVWGPEATKTHRYSAKRIIFGRLYGGGIPTLAKQGGVSEPVAASAVDVLDSFTPGLSAWSQRVREHVRQGDTRFRTYAGRVIYLPVAFPHKAPNYCIQGTARELLVDALLRWTDTRWGESTVLPVHDEILAAVPEPDATEATDALVAAMRTELFGVPITAEPSPPAFAWADAA